MFIGGVLVELRESHAISSTDLTKTLVHGVSKLAVVGHLSSLIEEFHNVDILGRELGRVDIEFAKKTSCLPEGCNVSTAYPRPAITRFLTSIFPSILLRHCHNILKCHVFGSSSGSLFGDSESCCS